MSQRRSVIVSARTDFSFASFGMAQGCYLLVTTAYSKCFFHNTIRESS